MLTRYKPQLFRIWEGQDGSTVDIEVTPQDDEGRQRLIINVRTPGGRIKAAADVETLLAPDIVLAASPLDLKKGKP